MTASSTYILTSRASSSALALLTLLTASSFLISPVDARRNALRRNLNFGSYATPRWSQSQAIRPDTTLYGPNLDFGQQVALSPDTNALVVGAPNYGGVGAGRIFAYKYNATSNQYDFEDIFAVLSLGLKYTFSFSGDGTILAVGAPSISGQTSSVQLRNHIGTQWTPDAQEYSCGVGELAAASVSISNDATLMSISSDFYLCVYEKPNFAPSWSLAQTLEPVDSARLVGMTTSISGSSTDTAYTALGIPGGKSNIGVVYLYNCSLNRGTTPCIQDATLNPPTPTIPNLQFGRSVTLSQDSSKLAIGANGAAYIYLRSGTTSPWYLVQKLNESSTYGSPASISEDGYTLLVGSTGSDGNATGPVYAYDWNGTKFVKTETLQANGVPENSFGEAAFVSITGTTIVVGAPQEVVNGVVAGGVYVYETAPTVSATASATASSSASGTRSGAATATASGTSAATATATPTATKSTSADATRTATSPATRSPTPSATSSRTAPPATLSATRSADPTRTSSGSASASATATGTGTTTASPQHEEPKSVVDTAVFAGSLSAAGAVAFVGLAGALTFWYKRMIRARGGGGVQRAAFNVTYGSGPVSGGGSGAVMGPQTGGELPHGYISLS